MKLGMVGLGKMGANMTKRLIAGGHDVVVTDLSDDAVKEAADNGAIASSSLEDLVGKLDSPKIVWVMVPSGKPTTSTLDNLGNLLDEGDIVIDGGNSNYKLTMEHAESLAEKGINMIDVGTSGGVWGLKEGYSMMVGGAKDNVEHISPILKTLAPAEDKGWGYVGPNGSGHFVKMVHNGIEYGMMQAYAEGFAIMKAKEEFGLDMAEISRIWQDGSVVRSWLLDLMHDAFDNDQDFDDIAAYVSDSGEGRWTVFEAIDLDVSAPVITAALLRRLRSREGENYTDKLLNVTRNQFGGHAIAKKDD
ncbi:MAG: decarboxylating 6-phosphogluconate dehydrogenase [Phototrophicaceae bacterium]